MFEQLEKKRDFWMSLDSKNITWDRKLWPIRGLFRPIQVKKFMYKAGCGQGFLSGKEGFPECLAHMKQI